MNHVYKVVRCVSTGVYKAVPEFTKSGKKTKSISIAAGVLAASLVINGSALAAVGDPVLSGETTDNAIAVGQANTVTGSNSTAMGHDNNISGESSTTVGAQNEVVGENHTIFGHNNNAGNFDVGYYDYDTNEWVEAFENFNNNTIVGNQNETRGNNSVAVGVNNRVESSQITVTGGDNHVDTENSGAYGQYNKVGTPNVTPQFYRIDDGSESGRLMRRYGLEEGGSYAYGNGNEAIGNQNHVVGNDNRLGADTSGVLGNGNYLINEYFEEPTFLGLDQYSRLRSNGSFLIGNDNNVEGNNTHSMGNANDIMAERNVTIGNANYVRVDNSNRFDQEVARAVTMALNPNQNTSTAIVGEANSLTQAGVHIVGTNNDVDQAYSYVVGGGNNIYSGESDSVFADESVTTNGSNVIGSDNTLESQGSSILGNSNQVNYNSPLTTVAGSQNRTDGLSNSIIGTGNDIEKDVGGAHGTFNRVAGNYGIITAIEDALRSEVFEGIDLDGDGIIDITNPEQAMQIVMESGSYAFGNINNLKGEGTHAVGNNNEFSGNNNKGLGNNNRIGQVGGLVGNTDAVLPTTTFNNSAAYGSDNVINADSALAVGNTNYVSGELYDGSINTNVPPSRNQQAIGNKNTLIGSNSSTVGSNNELYGNNLNVTGSNNNIGSVANVGENNTYQADVNITGNQNTVDGSNNSVFGSNNNSYASGSTILGSGNTIEASATDSVILGSNATSTIAGGIAIGNNSVADRANSVSVGAVGAERQITNVADGTQDKDAVNLGQLNASLRDTTGDENITATRTDTGYNVALNKALNVDSVTTGATSFDTDGIRAGDVFLSSTTGLNNAGNRVTNVGDAIENTDAVNYGQFKAGLTDTTAGKNVSVKRTDTGYEVSVIDDITLNSMIAGTTVVNTDGLKVGDVTVGSTGLDNAGNRVTSVGNAIERSDAVNYGQFTDGLAGTIKSVTGDENITATTDAEKNVIVELNKNAKLDSVTTGVSSMTTDGFRAGDVFLSSTTGLNNAGNRVTNVGDAIENTDAVNYGQFKAGLTDTTAGKNIAVKRTGTGYEVTLVEDVTLTSVTAGDTVINNAGFTNGATTVGRAGLKVGDVTVSSAGLSNAGNRITGVGNAVADDDAVNLGQVNKAIGDIDFEAVKTKVTGDENIVATTSGTGDVALSLASDINVGSLTAGAVMLSSTSGLNNAGFRVTGVGDAINNNDAINKGQLQSVDDRLTTINDTQNTSIFNNATNIQNNTIRINQGFFVGNGKTSNKFSLGDAIDITAGPNTVITTTDKGVQVGVANDLFVGSITAGGSNLSESGLTVGGVNVSSTSGLNNAGFTISGVGNAINDDDAVNLGQVKEVIGNIAVGGVSTAVTGDANIVATTTGNKVSLALSKDVAIDNSLSVGGVSITSNSGLNNAGFTVSGVGNAVDNDDAVNKGQLQSVDDRLTAKNAAQDIIINSKADKDYVDAKNNAQDTIIAGKADTSYVDAADNKLQAQINNKVDIEAFESSQQTQNQALKAETDRLDVVDKDLQAQVDNKVENTVFEADQARQDANLKKESEIRDSANKDLQAQVDKKVSKDAFEADQKRQDDALSGKADTSYVNTQISSQSISNDKKLSAMVERQSSIDNAQDFLIQDNSRMITDLGYRVDGIEDKLSAGIASAIAFASMPSAMTPGETRLSGGSGYYNGAGAIAVGLSGSNEDGAYNYKIGSSYTKEGGAVVGAGVSMRIW